MPPPDKRSGPHARTSRPPEHSTAADEAESTVADLAAWRERRAWARAVAWLHHHGLPAAVPCWLRAHGVAADWYYRNPCHPRGCGQGCAVLVADDGEPGLPEVHVCSRWTGAS
jgi:hypothetical protein